ncbi:MAG: KEOPS complex subunit Pcc1 [Nitrososphaerota archaeon]|nr:KEOPS complex subunit Pcc1 [Candidatus Bathyarchaeota archaeon]MDW8048791.1 KEOPS complex subunit Pcc1 [Nitrososphaerota archaeon]
MKVEAKISLEYDDSRKAEAIFKAVSPDNLKTPKNISIKSSRRGNQVSVLITYEDENLMTFLSTIDDLLSCVSVAEKALATLKKADREKE